MALSRTAIDSGRVDHRLRTQPPALGAVAVLLGVVTLGVLVFSASITPGGGRTENGRIVHRGGDGPLMVAGDGGNGIYAPKRMPWFATFGWANPCSTTGDTITIDDVRYDFKVEPDSVRSVAFQGKKGRGVSGIGSAKGTPEDELRTGEVLGEILGPAKGLTVTRSCDEPNDDGSLQILTVLGVGSRGAEVSEYFIDYTVGEPSTH